MAASNPNGEMSFWRDGVPYGGIKNGTKDMGEMQFWFDGLVGPWLFPPAAAGGQIKTIDGVAIAGVKTIDGVTKAQVKVKDGLVVN